MDIGVVMNELCWNFQAYLIFYYCKLFKTVYRLCTGPPLNTQYTVNGLNGYKQFIHVYGWSLSWKS